MSSDGRIQAGADRAAQLSRLPKRPPDKLWGGPATGGPCAMCGKPTTTGSVELELEFTRDADGCTDAYRVHPQCFSIFNVELDRRNRKVQSGGPGRNGSADGTFDQKQPAS